MNLSIAATLVAVSALIVYFLMRLLLPALNFERLLLLGSLALIAIFLMFMDRKRKLKKKSKQLQFYELAVQDAPTEIKR